MVNMGTHMMRSNAPQHEKFQSAPGSRVGTPAYLAPEVIMTTKGQTYDGKVRKPRSHESPLFALLRASGMYVLACSICDSCRLTRLGYSVADRGHLVMWSHAVRHAGGCLPFRAAGGQARQSEAAKNDSGAR